MNRSDAQKAGGVVILLGGDSSVHDVVCAKWLPMDTVSWADIGGNCFFLKKYIKHHRRRGP